MKILVADSSAVVRSIEKEILALNPAFEYAGGVSTIEEVREKAVKNMCDSLIIDSELFGKKELDSIFFELKQLHLKTILFVKSISKVFTGSSKIKIMEKPSFISCAQDKLKEYAVLFQEILEEKNCFVQENPAANIKKGQFDAVFIGVSTGGPAAIQKLLSGLNGDFPVPILIAQHIDSVFDKSLIDWLNKNTRLPVHLAESGVVPKKGNVYFAPADFHLVVKSDGANGFYMDLNKDEPVNFVRPSVDVLFFSAANVLKKKALAVLLTGMGNDGASGCVKIKEAGGYTITESEKSCVIYGMPKSAFEAGGSVEVMDLDKIAQRLMELAG